MPYQASSDTCLLFLVRHAATLNNLARPPRIQGTVDDSPLSEEGCQQAERTASFLCTQPLAAAFCSPLRRAAQTAEIIARPHGIVPLPVDRFHEVNVGRWEGRCWMEIEREEPEAYAQFVADPATHGYAGGENLQQVLDRVLPALQQLMRENLGKVILAVGHNVVNRVLLAHMLSVPLAKARSIDQDNCGVNVIRYRQEQLKVLTTNAAFHLQ